MALASRVLPVPGRTDHQDAARNLPAETLEFARLAQELHQLADLFLGFLDTCNIGEGDLDLVLTEHARLALAERHGAAAGAATLHLAHEENPHADQQQHREPVDEDRHQQAVLVGFDHFDIDLVAEQVIHHLGIIRGCLRDELAAVGAHALDGVPFDLDTLHLALLHLGDEIRIVDLLLGSCLGAEIVEHRHQHDGDDYPEQEILCKIVQTGVLKIYSNAAPDACLGPPNTWL